MSDDMAEALRLIEELTDSLNFHVGSTYSDTDPDDEKMVEEGRAFLAKHKGK